MQRVEGWYKARRRPSSVVALLVVTVLNTDSLTLANTPPRDATLRASVAQAAAQFVAEQQASQAGDVNALGSQDNINQMRHSQIRINQIPWRSLTLVEEINQPRYPPGCSRLPSAARRQDD